MLRLWGRLSSINVRKVVWTVQELGLTHQRTDAGGPFGIVQTSGYQALNPNALVPLIEDDGFTLWESNVIVRYLCARHDPGGLCPEGLQPRFDAERWMDWQQTTLNPAGRDAFVQLIRQPGGRIDTARVAQSVAATEPLLDLLDAHLARQAFLAGERFTMADIPVACEIHRWWGLPQPRPARPHLERWYAAVQARPASRGVLDLALA
ncbi:glutathione S-transferase family protein [Variovorax terrae]|uniref:Glutathione S-transferase n=1 Tax=Variovorax terrae TaxID=2923278 RepID=A0A9X1VTD7_9BURK|nr:glutathione S-transferase [Variovorax terrae]MCJ0761684.1 glutathione S-transferase [Variovorax terrae]